jgi:hypothetical protein
MRRADRSGELPISMGPVTVTRETAKAILVEFPGRKEVWIPQAAVHDNSEAWKQGDKGKLVVCAWFARARGWED